MLYCKVCYSPNLIKSGTSRHNGKQCYLCKDCKKTSYNPIKISGKLVSFLKSRKKNLCSKIIEINLVLADTAVLYKKMETANSKSFISEKIDQYLMLARLNELRYKEIEEINITQYSSSLLEEWALLLRQLEAELVKFSIRYLELQNTKIIK